MKGISRRSRNAWILCWTSAVGLCTILGFQLNDSLMRTSFLQFSWKRSFDAQAWSRWKPGNIHDNERWEMVEDLQANHLKPGMKRTEILRKLGKEGVQKNTHNLLYFVGDDGMDPVLFEIEFDSQERYLRSSLVFT